MELKSLSLCINWTAEQYKVFEHAIAVYDNETDPDRWLNIAKLVGRTNEEEVKRQYQILVEDIKSIESDKVPLPKYVKNEARRSKRNDMAKEEERLKKLNLQ